MSKVSLYDIDGLLNSEITDPNNDKISAKIIERETGNSYFIKVNISSVPYQPKNDIYMYSSTNVAKKRGIKLFKFVSVSEWAFDNYLNFLRSNNPRFLKEVERNLC